MLGSQVQIAPLRALVFRMAEHTRAFPLSALGAEAVAAAQGTGGLFVWEGDDGSNIRADCAATGVPYVTIRR